MKRAMACLFLLALILTMAGCAAGDARFDSGPAGFWFGLWHGLICFVAFVVSLFSNSVHIYEVRNTGHLYDLGFVLGAMIAFGGIRSSHKHRPWKTCGEKDWDKYGPVVEEKVRKGIRAWIDESGNKDPEWEEIGRKVEEKVKRELRNWAEK